MISIVITAYNEQKYIVSCLKRVLSNLDELEIHDYELIIVDDGSTDKTGILVQGFIKSKCLNIKYIRHESNKGLGKVIKTGILAAQGAKLMIVPGDNDMSSNLIKSMLRNRDKAELVVAALLNIEARSRYRVILSLSYRLIYYIFFGNPLFYLNGPSIWPIKKLKLMKIKSDGFSIVSEINTKLIRAGASFCEIPGYSTNLEESSATVSVRNFIEVIYNFFCLLFFCYFSKEVTKKTKAKRVYIDF